MQQGFSGLCQAFKFRAKLYVLTVHQRSLTSHVTVFLGGGGEGEQAAEGGWGEEGEGGIAKEIRPPRRVA